MSNGLPATTPPGAPPQVSESQARSGTWQQAPPGPPGAAIDPPPCVTPLAVAAPAPRVAGDGERASAFEPRMPLNQLLALEPHGEWFPIPGTTATRSRSSEPIPIQGQVVEPAVIGKETPAAELDKLLRDSGWTERTT